jgi:hypothetical protein
MLNVQQSRVAAESGAHPRRGVVVLYGHSAPVQRAPHLATGQRLIGLGGPAARPIRVQGDYRTKPSVVPLDRVELIFEDVGH